MKTSFWTYFTSGYGVLLLILLGLSLITRSHIDAGLFGLIGFPVIAAIYAWVRRSKDAEAKRSERVVLPPRMIEFLEIHPEFLNAPQRLRDTAFHNWLNNPNIG